MSTELEVAGASAIGEMSAGGEANLSGQPCRNCGTDVSERFCPNCGQLAASFHRPVWSLVSETISDSFALDGRIARTLPMLIFRPGKLTRAYTSGQRARFVPPFRLFLLASLVFYFALFAVIANSGAFSGIDLSNAQDKSVEIVDENGVTVERPVIDEAGHLDRDAVKQILADEDSGDAPSDEIVDQISTVTENPALFQANLEKWAPRLSVLFAPLTIFALAVLHIWRRKIYVYDHAVHALHLHSWIYLTATAVMLLAPLVGGGLWGWYALFFGLYTWRSLMVAYDSGWAMALLRLLILSLFWVFVVSALVLAAIIVSGLAVQG